LKKRILHGLLILIFVFSGFFITAMATYPDGVLAALSDPWSAINQLFTKIADFERRIGIIERFLGMIPNETKEYPYLATLAPKLAEKIEARYSWRYIYSREWNETIEDYGPKKLTNILIEIQITNLSNQTIRTVYLDIIIRNAQGNILIDGSNIIMGMSMGNDQDTIIKTLKDYPAAILDLRPKRSSNLEIEISNLYINNETISFHELLEKKGIDPFKEDPELTVEVIITSVKFVK